MPKRHNKPTEQDILAALEDKETVLSVDDVNQQGGESIEHIDFGDSAFSTILATPEYHAILEQVAKQGFYDTRKKTFKLPNGLKLTYGQIVALAGDFFTSEQPISEGSPNNEQQERKARFIEAHGTLAQKKQAVMVVGELLKSFRAQVKQIRDEQAANPEKTAIAIQEDHENEHMREYINTTKHKPHSIWDIRGRLKAIFLPNYLNNRYTDLLKVNYDHFVPDAHHVYEIGHALAFQKAQEAHALAQTHKEKQTKEAYQLLAEALTLEAFAGHYSTDAFSSGHMRVLRKAIPEYTQTHLGYDEKTFKAIATRLAVNGIVGADTLGHLLVHEQHDEDGEHGLWVTNKLNPDGWMAYGDKTFFEPKSEPNRAMLLNTVKAGIQDIFNAFKLGPQAQPTDFNRYWPVPDSPKHPIPGHTQNHYALFKPSKKAPGGIKKRENAGNIDCKTYVTDWTAQQAIEERGISLTEQAMSFLRH